MIVRLGNQITIRKKSEEARREMGRSRKRNAKRNQRRSYGGLGRVCLFALYRKKWRVDASTT